METGILSQTMHSKVRQIQLKTWVFATSNGTRKLSEPLVSRFRVMYLNEYEFSQFYNIAVKKLLAEGLDKNAADEIAISVWEQIPNPNTVSYAGTVLQVACIYGRTSYPALSHYHAK